MVNHLPCSFCGSTELEVQERKRDRAFFVECQSCRARGPVHGLERIAWEAWNKQEGDGQALLQALVSLVQECDYSASSGIPFNFPDGLGRWTQLAKAKALLAKKA